MGSTDEPCPAAYGVGWVKKGTCVLGFRKNTADSGKNIVQKVSMAKYWLGETVNRIAHQAVQLHGGYGYMEEYRVCKIYRDVRCLSIFAGTSEIMKLIVSRSLGLNP